MSPKSQQNVAEISAICRQNQYRHIGENFFGNIYRRTNIAISKTQYRSCQIPIHEKVMQAMPLCSIRQKMMVLLNDPGHKIVLHRINSSQLMPTELGRSWALAVLNKNSHINSQICSTLNLKGQQRLSFRVLKGAWLALDSTCFQGHTDFIC